jgi:hypothetical protein
MGRNAHQQWSRDDGERTEAQLPVGSKAAVPIERFLL